MKRPLVTIVLILSFPFLALSDQIQRVPDAIKHKVPTPPPSFQGYVPYAIAYEPGFGRGNILFLSPELSASAELFRTTPKQKNYDVRFSIGRTLFTIKYDDGPSSDPGFLISSAALGKATILRGKILYVSTPGSFYVTARTNEDYMVNRKYVIQNKALSEIRQAFYLVDLQCTTSDLLVIYEKKCGKGNIVAKIPKGMSVRVLLNDIESSCSEGEQYLVSTAFGLVGWVSSEAGYMHFKKGKPLSCLNYIGD